LCPKIEIIFATLEPNQLMHIHSIVRYKNYKSGDIGLVM